MWLCGGGGVWGGGGGGGGGGCCLCVVTDAQTHLHCVLITGKQCVQLHEPPPSSLLMSCIPLSSVLLSL